MLRVTVEILDGGDERRKKKLGTLDISNISELAPVSDYRVGWTDGETGHVGIVFVTGHRRSDGWRKLVGRACEKLGWVKESS